MEGVFDTYKPGCSMMGGGGKRRRAGERESKGRVRSTPAAKPFFLGSYTVRYPSTPLPRNTEKKTICNHRSSTTIHLSWHDCGLVRWKTFFTSAVM